MSRHDDLLALVNDIYSAASDSDHWPRVWANLCTLMGSNSAGILSTAAPVTSPALFAGITAPEASALYNAYYGRLDPWLAASKRLDLSHGPQAVVGDRLVSRALLSRTEFYADFGRRFDVVQPIAVVHKRSPADVFALTIVRSERAPAWEAADAAVVAVLGPHLERAIDIHGRLSTIDGRARLLEDGLDSLAVGVVCVDAAGDAVFVNRQARRIANARDGFGFDGRRPTTASTEGRAALQSRLAAALTGDPGLRRVPPGPLLVPRPSGRAAYRVDVAPAGRSSDRGHRRLLNGAILFIDDPADQPAARVPRLMALFGLTASEAAVASAVGAGQSLEDIAAARGVSVQTVRTQLKQIFSKTGTNRQSALAALIERTASPVTHP
jgi:DNA-binding CsgD family transcriptional regulator/PAS domain-containing protein